MRIDLTLFRDIRLAQIWRAVLKIFQLAGLICRILMSKAPGCLLWLRKTNLSVGLPEVFREGGLGIARVAIDHTL